MSAGHHRGRRPLAATAALTTGLLAGLAAADDTDIYIGAGRDVDTVRPNILFVLDTSGSMLLTDGAIDANGKPYTRLARMQDAFSRVMATTEDVNVGLMRFHYRDGGPVVFPVTPIDDTVNEPVMVRVARAADDAQEQLGTGQVSTNDPVLKLGLVEGDPLAAGSFERSVEGTGSSAVRFTGGGPYQRDPETIRLSFAGWRQPFSGLRFQNLPADTRGATVTSARLRLAASENFAGNARLLVAGHRVPDSDAYGSRATSRCQSNTANADPLCRFQVALTRATSRPTVPAQRRGNLFTLDVAGPVQELFRTGGYQATRNADDISLLIVGLARERAAVYGSDGPAALRPTLVVDYQPEDTRGPQRQRIALRFTDVRIPQGARISSAAVEMTPVGDSSEPVSLSLSFENSASAELLTEARRDLSGRDSTSAVNWSLGGDAAWRSGETVQTPSVASALQAVVDRRDWCGGNDLVLLMDVEAGSDGMRAVAAHDYVPGGSSAEFPAPALNVVLESGQTYGPGQGCTVTNRSIRVAGRADDARSNSGGNAYEDHTGYLDGDYGYFGTRFEDVPVPRGAGIRRATLYMTSSTNAASGDESSFRSRYRFHGDRSADSESFSSGARAPGRRPATRVTTEVVLPSVRPSYGVEAAVADVTGIVQEITGYDGWRAGNALSIIGRFSSGYRSYPEFHSYNFRPGHAPRLELVYRYNLGDLPGAASGPLTVREHLTQLVDDFPGNGATPIVDALYEALGYYRGGDVTWGRQRGRQYDPTYSRRSTRVSHPRSYTGGRVDRPPACTDNDLGAAGCEDERIGGSPRYVSPITDPCQSNHVVLLTDGEASANVSQALSQALIGRSCRAKLLDGSSNVSYYESCGLDLAQYGSETDLSAAAGDNTVKLHTIGFNFSSDFLRDLSVAGAGEFKTAASVDDLAGVFANLFEAIRGSKAFAPPAVPANAFNRLFSGDDVYLSQFEPTLERRWLGNVKKYRICQSSADGTPGGACEVGSLIDAVGRAATDDLGRISDSSRSLWRNDSDPVDGAEIGLGGIAGRLARTRPESRYVYFDSKPDAALPDGGLAPGGSETLTGEVELLRFADTDSGPAAGSDIGTIDALEGTGALPGDDFRKTAQILSMAAVPAGAEQRRSVRDHINWIRGQDVDDEDGDGDTSEMRHAVGDPLHASPVVVTYNRIDRARSDGSRDRRTIAKLFITSNDGGLRMVDAETGEEEWLFIPRELLARQAAMRNPGVGEHHYGLDSTPVVWRHDADGDNAIERADGDFVRLLFGMRRGGQSYYALDVTPATPLTRSGTNDDGSPTITPKLLWRVNRADGDLPNLGQTWSRPQVARMLVGRESTGTRDKTEVRNVVFIGGGYDPSHDDSFAARGDGNAIYLLDADTGERLYWVSGRETRAQHRRPFQAGTARGIEAPGMEFPIPADLRLLDTDNDRLIDRILVGDIGGQVWRVDLRAHRGVRDGIQGVAARLASLAFGKRVTASELPTLSVDAADQRRFFSQPDLVRVRGDNLYSRTSDYDLVVIGSGTRPNPLDTDTRDYLYILRDFNPGSLFNSDLDGNGLIDTFSDGEVPGFRLGDADATIGNVEDELLSVGRQVDGNLVGVTPRSAQAARGLRIALQETGEKALSRPLVVAGKVVFTTYVPGASQDGNSCTGAEGGGRLHVVNLITGATVHDTETLGAGIPSSPALFFRDLKVPAGDGDPDTGILVGTGGGSTVIAPPDLVKPLDTLPGSHRGVNRRQSKKWDNLEYGIYWFENPD